MMPFFTGGDSKCLIEMSLIKLRGVPNNIIVPFLDSLFKQLFLVLRKRGREAGNPPCCGLRRTPS